MIEVVNRRNFRGEGVYVGRRMRDIAGSPLGNDFRIGPDGTRAEVVAKYRAWLWRQIRCGEGPAFEELSRLAGLARAGQDLRLICWCAPLPCHGTVIAKAIRWMIDRDGKEKCF